MKIHFKAEDHSYTSTDPTDNKKWLSVTSLVELFKKPFDQKGIALACSKSNKSKWGGMTPEKIIEIWTNESNRAIGLGSWYHDQREQELIMCDTLQRDGIDLQIIRPLEQDGIKLSPDQSLMPGIYPEHLVYLKSARLSGQADRVEVVGDRIDIYDYKTNKEIKTEGYTNWEGVTKKMLGPLSHLDDCHLTHYSLQLSIYMYMMLKHNHNLKPGKMEIHHITFKKEGEDEYGYPIVAEDPNGNPIVDQVIPYKLDYLKKEVRAMINYVKQHPEVLERGHI